MPPGEDRWSLPAPGIRRLVELHLVLAPLERFDSTWDNHAMPSQSDTQVLYRSDGVQISLVECRRPVVRQNILRAFGAGEDARVWFALAEDTGRLSMAAKTVKRSSW